MKRLLLLFTFLLTPLVVPAAPAAKPVEPKPAEVTLPLTALMKPIGVEPQGGHFQSVLPAHAPAGKPGEMTFTTESRNQGRSTLAIFATDSEQMRDEKPLTRLEIFLLAPGEQKDRIRVRLTPGAFGKVTVEAFDVSLNRPLSVQELTRDKVKNTKYAVAKTPPAPPTPPAPIAAHGAGKPAPIASLDTHSAAAGRAALAQSIGVRTAGGMVQPLLPAGSLPGTTKSYYLRPRYPDQTTADVTLLAGDSPYVENNKLAERYLISGIPTHENRRIRLDLTVGPNGKLLLPKATEVYSKQDLHIEKYSNSAAQRLEEAPRPAQPVQTRRIPAAPAA